MSALQYDSFVYIVNRANFKGFATRFCHFWPKIGILWAQYKPMACFELGKNAESGLNLRVLKVENSIFSSIVVRLRNLFDNNALKDTFLLNC